MNVNIGARIQAPDRPSFLLSDAQRIHLFFFSLVMVQDIATIDWPLAGAYATVAPPLVAGVKRAHYLPNRTFKLSNFVTRAPMR